MLVKMRDLRKDGDNVEIKGKLKDLGKGIATNISFYVALNQKKSRTIQEAN